MTQYRREMNKYIDHCTNFKSFRLKICQQHYFILDLRYFSIWALTSCPKDLIEEKAKKYNVSRRDALTLANLKSNTKLVGRLKQFKEKYLNGRTPLVRKIRKQCQVIISDIDQDVLRVVRRRLKFVQTFHSIPISDLHSDLMIRLIQQFYWSYKVRDSKYQRLYALQVANNYVRNVAHYYYAAKRRVSSVRDKDGISTRLVLNSSELSEAQQAMVASQSSVDYRSSLDNQVLCMQIFKNHGTTKKKRLMLNILAGNFNAGFSEWLVLNKYVQKNKGHTNMEYQDMVTRLQFLTVLCSYLKMRPKVAKEFIKNIKETCDVKQCTS